MMITVRIEGLKHTLSNSHQQGLVPGVGKVGSRCSEGCDDDDADGDGGGEEDKDDDDIIREGPTPLPVLQTQQ